MERILFVDDEPHILQGLKRVLHSMRQEWQMDFAGSGQEALELLARQPCDVLVTDMRMPGMSGLELLTSVRRDHPQVVRLLLSGQADQEAILRSVGPAHRYLSKPCDTDLLKSTLLRMCALRCMLVGEPLKQLILEVKCLPSAPALYTELVALMQDPEVSMNRVGDLVARDIAMASKLLQVVNSSFFGLPRPVSHPAQAVGLIGLERLRTLVLSLQLFSQFETGPSLPISLPSLWQHSMQVALFAKQIVQAQGGERSLQDDAFTAGLLHDSGKMLLASGWPQRYRDMLTCVRKKPMSLLEAERQTFGATHAEVGAFLMDLWGLPNTIVEALALHHAPPRLERQVFDTVTAVHLANGFAHELKPGSLGSVSDPWDKEYIHDLGLTEQIPIWQDLCSSTRVG